MAIFLLVFIGFALLTLKAVVICQEIWLLGIRMNAKMRSRPAIMTLSAVVVLILVARFLMLALVSFITLLNKIIQIVRINRVLER